MSHRLWLLLLGATLNGQTGTPRCAWDRAVQLHQSADFPGAAREYEVCLGSNPDRAEARSNLGAVLVKLGRYREAIDQYQAALKIAPSAIQSQLHFNLALAYYKSFQIGLAASELEALHAAQPADLKLALLLADCRLRTGRFKEAIDLLGPFDAQPGEPALDYVAGMALIRSGMVAEGQRRVDRILGRGESAEGRLLLGVARFTGGDFPGAVQEFAKAEALNPALPSLHSYHGQALLFTGDADAAVAAFRKELASNPNDFDANFHLASILSHRGKPEEARALLERAAQVRPDSEEARDALAHGFRFDAHSQSAGDPGVPVGAPAPAIPEIDLAHPAKPLVLVFGSYTCPQLRGSAADLKRVAADYQGRVDFRLVYIREAHTSTGPAGSWQSTINEREGVALPAARNLSERRRHADFCVRKLDLGWPAVADSMDNAAEAAYQAWPSRVYIVGQDGRVAFNSRLGELEFRPGSLEAALTQLLAKGAPDGRSH